MIPSRCLLLATLAAASACGSEARADSRTDCRGTHGAAIVEIGSVPAGTRIKGSLRRKVRTGDRLTIAMNGRGRVTCRRGDPSILKEVIDELERNLQIAID